MDILIAVPFLVDAIGKTAGLYDEGEWRWLLDHFVNWIVIVTLFGVFLATRRLPRAVVAALAVGFGAVAAILWEIAEYFLIIRHSSETATAYTDTLADLGVGLAASTVAAAVTVTVLWRRPA